MRIDQPNKARRGSCGFAHDNARGQANLEQESRKGSYSEVAKRAEAQGSSNVSDGQ